MADSSSLIGQTISHYRIVEKLGGGGMAWWSHGNTLLRRWPRRGVTLRHRIGGRPMELDELMALSLDGH